MSAVVSGVVLRANIFLAHFCTRETGLIRFPSVEENFNEVANIADA